VFALNSNLPQGFILHGPLRKIAGQKPTLLDAKMFLWTEYFKDVNQGVDAIRAKISEEGLISEQLHLLDAMVEPGQRRIVNLGVVVNNQQFSAANQIH
jgi:hypothetical protein